MVGRGLELRKGICLKGGISEHTKKNAEMSMTRGHIQLVQVIPKSREPRATDLGKRGSKAGRLWVGG